MSARTGVEMEAMTAAAVAALTVYDMVKGLERGVDASSVEVVPAREVAAGAAGDLAPRRRLSRARPRS